MGGEFRSVSVGEIGDFSVEIEAQMSETRQVSSERASVVQTDGAPKQDPIAKDDQEMPSPKSTRSPAFQFYPSDFLSSTKVDRMSMTERGAYITLLSRCWLDDGLPTDLDDLAAMVRMKPAQFDRMWKNGQLSKCFEERAGRLVNPRQQKERKKQAAFHARQAENGSKGGRPRKTHSEPVGISGLTHSKPRALKIERESSLSGVPSSEKEGDAPLDGQVLFLALVECYPEERRTDDHPTQVEFIDALGPYAEWQERYGLMLRTLDEHKASDQWRRGVVPNLHTWLKRGDWRGTRKLATQPAATGTDRRPAWAR